MLKIKNTVNLKDLEKFGFKVDEGEYGLCRKTTMKDRRWYIDEETKKRVYDTFSNEIIITKEKREIFISVSIKTNDYVCGMGTNCCELEVLYDLILEGLVEKV